MTKENLLNLQDKLNKLIYQIDNHQQSRNVVADVESLLSNLHNMNKFSKQESIYNSLGLIKGAIADPFGLGKLNLLLDNARIPKKYYDIFYNMLLRIGGGTVCIDCGAHAGLISDIILHCGGKSYIFEPNLHLNFFLNKKYENNKNAILYQKAVGVKNYITKFLIFEDRILSQGNRIISSKQDNKTSKSYDVHVIDLCEFIEELLKKNERIYFLKLDVEGSEFEILEKLIQKKLYKKITYIACEMHHYMFDDGEKKMSRLKTLIKEFDVKNILIDWV
ncbi:FkbM family methyltransferase [Campylobacter novaezeelandiae]|uniref:FkbM family methyltransferase n=1 Tax=Campylobacter novaezeelandiae TaxID=2267891 RepID=A0A4Q9JUH9_9BACT|nr:FkbM family methyltransferase [Campylobacter novaezeelandiae]TBR81314.1 FkbM family methyltransferase [Campylobacter novaezeelandiae]